MKLITFTHNNKQQIGAVEGEYVIPIGDDGPDNLIDFFTTENTVKQQLEDKI